MPQLSYSINPPPFIVGQVSDSREGCVIVSGLAQGLVSIGLLCANGTIGASGPQPTLADPNSTTPRTVIPLPSGTFLDDPMLDSSFVGVAIYDASRPPMTALNQYSVGDQVGIILKGPVAVVSETATTQGADVYVRVTTSGLALAGQFRMGAAAGFVKFSRGRWDFTTTGAGVSRLVIW